MRKLLLMIALTGCGGEDVPSCQQAMSHYYASQCTFYDLSTDPPTEIPLGGALSACQQINVDVPERCRGEFEDWLFCLDSTPATAATNADCDCSREQDALFACP